MRGYRKGGPGWRNPVLGGGSSPSTHSLWRGSQQSQQTWSDPSCLQIPLSSCRPDTFSQSMCWWSSCWWRTGCGPHSWFFSMGYKSQHCVKTCADSKYFMGSQISNKFCNKKRRKLSGTYLVHKATFVWHFSKLTYKKWKCWYFQTLSTKQAYNGYQPCHKVLWINSAANITFSVVTLETKGIWTVNPDVGRWGHFQTHFQTLYALGGTLA